VKNIMKLGLIIYLTFVIDMIFQRLIIGRGVRRGGQFIHYTLYFWPFIPYTLHYQPFIPYIFEDLYLIFYLYLIFCGIYIIQHTVYIPQKGYVFLEAWCTYLGNIFSPKMYSSILEITLIFVPDTFFDIF